MMALRIDRLIRAVRPVIRAVVVQLRLLDNLRARGARAFTMGVHVVDADAKRLRVRSAQGAWALAECPGARGGLAAGADHDQPLTKDELGVLDSTAFSLYFETHFETEGATQPIDCLGGILVEDRRRNSLPAFRWCLHGESPLLDCNGIVTKSCSASSDGRARLASQHAG